MKFFVKNQLLGMMIGDLLNLLLIYIHTDLQLSSDLTNNLGNIALSLLGENNIDKDKRPKWLERTSLSNLADIHNHYCKPKTKMDKDVRNSFVKLSLAELREDIPNLLAYCLKVHHGYMIRIFVYLPVIFTYYIPAHIWMSK